MTKDDTRWRTTTLGGTTNTWRWRIREFGEEEEEEEDNTPIQFMILSPK